MREILNFLHSSRQAMHQWELFKFFLFVFMLWTKGLDAHHQLWSQSTGASAEGFGNCVAVDTNRNVYVTGYVSGALDSQIHAGGYDMVVMKYNASGARQWTRLRGTAGNDFGYGGDR